MKPRGLNVISSVSFAFSLIAVFIQPATGSKVSKRPDNHQFVKNLAPLLVQQPLSQVVRVTGVKLNNTNTGIELILQTSQDEALKPIAKTESNTFIADIPNAVLQLPDGKEFRSLNPAKGIVSVTVTALDANSIRVTVTGEASSPKVELFDDPEGLVFGFTPAPSEQAQTQPTSPQQPRNETQPQPTAQDDEPIELVVTGEQDGYRASEASTATKTDTPLRDIPASIDVVPRQLIQDRQVTRTEQATQTVAGVQSAGGGYGGLSSPYLSIRGFASTTTYRDGFRDFGFLSPSDVANIDRLEILKGPASVLYGQNDPGGIVNIV